MGQQVKAMPGVPSSVALANRQPPRLYEGMAQRHNALPHSGDRQGQYAAGAARAHKRPKPVRREEGERLACNVCHKAWSCASAYAT